MHLLHSLAHHAEPCFNILQDRNPTKVRYDQWADTEDYWIKHAHPYPFVFNTKLREKKTVIQDLVKRCFTFKKSITFDSIFSHLRQHGDRNSFYEFVQQYIKNPPENWNLIRFTRVSYARDGIYLVPKMNRPGFVVKVNSEFLSIFADNLKPVFV